LDVLKWIRKEPWSSLPVIMLTASAEDVDIAEAYRLGANAFLRKPSEARELDEIARVIMDFWLKLNVLPQGGVVESRLEEVLPA
jgi:two-component system, response regulator